MDADDANPSADAAELSVGTPRDRAPRSTHRFWALVILAGSTAVGLLRFAYKYLEMVIARGSAQALPPLIDELTAAWGGALLFCATIPALTRFPLTRERWLRRLPLYLALAAAVSVAHTIWNAVSRTTLYPLFGLGAYDYGSMVLRIPMETANQVIYYATFVGLVHGFLWYRGLKDREIRAARLEAELGRAQLANLRERLHPHFLFNTLNAISSEMYRDIEAADRMISRLSDLLRAALDAGPEQETTLAGELELLGIYLEIMRVRHGERLCTRVEVDDDARAARIPVLLLQPLVENAIAHGVAERPGRGEVVVTARVVGADGSAAAGPAAVPGPGRGEGEGEGRTANGPVLRIEVLDDGPGLDCTPEDALRAGVGLSTTEARLRCLYGEAASLTIANRTDRGGTRVTITLPYRPADPAMASPRESQHHVAGGPGRGAPHAAASADA
ncbi:MAG TPA: histidine kinase [Longimicrobiales bacterium]